jgi:hypothetical protein
MSRHRRLDRSAAPFAWDLALGMATVVGTLVTTCMMPFVALSVMAAATLPRGRAVVTVAAAWLANQALGFSVQHYPLTTTSFAWGAAAGVAALAVVLAASFVVDRTRLSVLRTVGALALGFALYEGLLFGFAQLNGGGTATFTPAIVAQIGGNEVVWLAGLAAVHLMLTWRAPRWFGRRPALSLA